MVTAALWAASAAAQTRIDLQRQTRNIDFTEAEYTKPFRAGAALPGTCAPGEFFFLSAAASGENLYACTAADRWEAQGRATLLHIEGADTLTGTRDTVNFLAGPGLMNVTLDAERKVNVQYAANTAVLLTRAGHQSGESLLCESSGGSGNAYSCHMNPTLETYKRGMVVHWVPDADGTGGATTLAVDILDAHPVKLADGVSDPAAGDIVAGTLYPVWFDGMAFRLAKHPATKSGERPACAAEMRGRLWLSMGDAGIKDSVAICVRDAAQAWVWEVLN
jgi:hypothetical protein